MAGLPFSNTDFVNAKRSLELYRRALEDVDAQNGGPQRLRTLSGAALDQAKVNLERDIKAIAQSPFARPLASQYPSLPLEAVQPMRELYATLIPFKDCDEVEWERQRGEELFATLRRQVAAVVGAITPDHPFLSWVKEEEKKEKKKEKEETGEGEEVKEEEEEEEGKAKAKGKQRADADITMGKHLSPVVTRFKLMLATRRKEATR